MPFRFQLKNGLTVLLVERHNLPIVSANVITLSGGGANPSGKPSSLASFVTDMLNEGTRKRSSFALAADTSNIYCATLSAGAGWRHGVRQQCCVTLTRNTDAGFEILSDEVLHPAFDEKEIERKRSQRLTAIVQENENAATLRTKTLIRVLYGDSVYGYTALGTEASNKTVTRDDLVTFWKHGILFPSSAALSSRRHFAGDYGMLAEKYFGQWKGSPSVPVRPSVPANSTRAVYIVDKPGAPQTSLAIGIACLPREAYPTMYGNRT